VDISIRHRNVDVPAPLREMVEEKVGRLSRFLEGMERAEVAFSEEKNPRIAEKERCEVTMHGHGHVVRAHAAGHEAAVAVDRVVDKLEHRLEKLKGKLVGRSHPRRRASVDFAANGDESEEDAVDGRLQIVKTKKFAMKPMTPEEAALQMDLVGHDFYFFRNAETDQSAVVYRRNDGHIGLIDAG
jgi:putative sigma-54 modulation protein